MSNLSPLLKAKEEETFEKLDKLIYWEAPEQEENAREIISQALTEVWGKAYEAGQNDAFEYATKKVLRMF